MFKRLFSKLLGSHTEAMSFRQGLDLTGLPIVTLGQGENRFNFILDTGSDISMIDSNAMPFIKHEVLPDIEGSVIGMDGIMHKTTVCNVTMYYKDKSLEFDCLVKDLSDSFKTMKNRYGVNLHGMIGSKFFNKYKYILDFNEMIAYSKV